MPKKLEYEDVKNTFEENGCVLLSKEYTKNTQTLSYIAKCGHNYELTYLSFRKSLSKKCRECNIIKRDIIFYNEYSAKSFKKTKRLMGTYYTRALRYRNDYLPENYEKTKKCSNCEKTKTIKVFYNNKNYKDPVCKLCYNTINMKKRSVHNEDQIITNLISQSKASSKKRGKRCPFDITLEDVKNQVQLQNNKCIYTGREFVYSYNESDKPSIDRIDSSKGYTKDNIQMVTTRANAMKNDMTHEEFLELIKDIYENCK